MRNKKIIAICLFSTLLLPQVKVQALSDEVKNNIEIGEVYNKTIIKSMTRTSLSQKDKETMSKEKIEEIGVIDKEKEDTEVLIPKTNSNYEVTLAYEDGNYRYVDDVEDFNEAVKIAKESEEISLVRNSNSSIIPTVIDSTGNVVYATESVGRAWKKYDDGITKDRDMCLYLYNNANFSGECAYFSDSNISEFPLIEQIGDAAKCYVSGKIGWGNTNLYRDVRGCGHNNRDILIQPINSVKNPSYYVVSNGILKHWVSTSMSTVGSGNWKDVGIAPGYLSPGKRYFSYDGNYFYDAWRGTADTLRIITSDLRKGNFNNAVNKDNPYYAYYNYLPFRSKTNYTAAELDSYIYSHTSGESKLRGLGQTFINVQNKYGVNALLALSVAINESAWGNSEIAQAKNNLFGLNATDRNPGQDADTFTSPQACVEYFAKNWISRGYADTADWRNYGGFLGNKALGANVKYASDPYWGETATSIAFGIDRYLSGNDLSKLRDYDNYQLIRYSAMNNVSNYYGSLLYNVNSSVNPGIGYFVGGIEALSTTERISKNGTDYYEIYPARTTATNSGGRSNKFGGDYNWNIRGYVPCRNIQYINKSRRNWSSADVNKDGVVDILDLTIEAGHYNQNLINSNIDLDINRDGIIDIYDIVRVSCKL